MRLSSNFLVDQFINKMDTDDAYLARRRKRRVQTYKLNEAQVAQLEAVQACQLCGIPQHKVRCMHIDHCHSSGWVRGVLCGACNISIGYIERLMRQGILNKAVEWVTKWEE